MRVLVTNDDGIDAPGLRALAGAVTGAGHDVVVVAPLDDRSGCGAGMAYTPGEPVATVEKEFPELPGVPFVGIDGTPALAVMLARIGTFGPPPWCVASGVNRGSNTGRAILHSGTVGGALAAASLGMSGIAVSMDSDEPVHVGTAAEVAGYATNWLAGARKRTVLNINVPDLSLAEVRGVRWARLAAVGRRVLRADRREGTGPRVWLDASGLPEDPTTDAQLLADGYVTVTPVGTLHGLPDNGSAQALDEALMCTAPQRRTEEQPDR
ncbi:5'/3'-nucleotidase SurE [Amycolatopsis sp. GM8]|uniref:5'/3'-nucleotidase SurE n=1 Tax=Amycolatopsis sp. GM8 TaxID=2896530 RepID=UPI001F317B27|nr:5'/3'-nucleotidase SurE [Amycolatopsis sp. GM8]